MLKIDKAKAIELLQEIVDEAGPEAKYETSAQGPGCFYVHRFDVDGNRLLYSYGGAVKREPGCIIGRMLINAGVPIEWFDKHEGYFSVSHVEALRLLNLLDITKDAQDLMSAVQELQDNGVTWKNALANSI